MFGHPALARELIDVVTVHGPPTDLPAAENKKLLTYAPDSPDHQPTQEPNDHHHHHNDTTTTYATLHGLEVQGFAVSTYGHFGPNLTAHLARLCCNLAVTSPTGLPAAKLRRQFIQCISVALARYRATAISSA